MLISIQRLWILFIVFSSAQSQTTNIDLESTKNHELNKTILQSDNITKSNSHPSTKPFLPFSNLGAPAGPPKLNLEQDQIAKSSKLIKNEDRVAKSILQSIHKGIYTTLDKFPPRKSKINLKKLIGENLGGLSPEEIYYIDKDLLIIKGGDFEGKKYLKKYGRRKDAKRLRRIKNKPHKSPPGLRFKSTSEGNTDNTSSEEDWKDSNSLPPTEIATSELSLFLPSFQVKRHQQKQASAHHYFYMPPPPPDVQEEHTNILPHFLFDDHFHQHPEDFHSHVNYQDKFKYDQHFDRNNAALHLNWLPAAFEVAHSYFGDTNINYKFPKKLPNPDASWISLKSHIK